jgi:hypothetical protein
MIFTAEDRAQLRCQHPEGDLSVGDKHRAG